MPDGDVELDAASCHRAMLSRDRRFDGRFFAGVVTTGVYCRPICPVVPAKFENTLYFACAAAAEAAGFRPCMRCRPETSPGTPAWLGSSAVVSRALRLIAEGALDEGCIDTLAARLGIGGRQLRRLFAKHLGASPGEIARARRVHFARTLIDQTGLPMTQVALSAGFSSLRQFNHAIRATFRHSPTELRRRRGKRHAPGARDAEQGELTVRLPYRPPLGWDATIRFLAARAIPGVEAVDPGSYRRTIELAGAPGTIDLRPAPSGEPYLVMWVRLATCEGLIQVVERARRVFDLNADPLQIDQHLRRSPRLARLLDRFPGLRVPGAWDGFELAVRAILGQQVTVSGATTLSGRLVRAFGVPIEGFGEGLSHLFPRPEVLAEADLGTIGIPQARASTIRGLSLAVARGELALDASQGLEDAVSRLCAIPGIGLWTAHYIAMRAYAEPDAFPAMDLGLRRALGNGRGPLPSHALERIADAWRPWRAYAAMALWLGAAAAGSHAKGTSPERRTSS
jgi:AraC family transcriptional regulator of adaptative response / DNA-3-methyladenine glycosylase II